MATSLLQSFGCALSGIMHSLVTGRNFKIEIGFAVAAVALGVALEVDAMSWALLIICMGAVLGAECINTAVEAVVDLVTLEYDERAKHAKDCAAGGVLICAVASLFVAACVFIPPFITLALG